MTKRKKRDPLAGLKKKHPGPWKVEQYETLGGYCLWCVVDAHRSWVQDNINFLTLAREIAKLGGGK